MKISHKPIVTIEGHLTLTEDELGALDALAGYGTDPFLKTFYKEMGEAYLKPHERGLRTLFDKIKSVSGPALRDAEQMRRDLREAIKRREQTATAQQDHQP